MKLYKTKLTPRSEFATPLKGDTLFGQMCWSIAYLYGQDRLESLLDTYTQKPFMVVSDAFVPGYLPKPSLPSELLGEKSEEKKSNRRKIWMTPQMLSSGDCANAKTDTEVNNKDGQVNKVHNSLDYRSFNTGTDEFAPYSVTEYHIGPKDIYLLIDESAISSEEVKELLSFTGLHGYGKDASIGKGRFDISPLEAAELPQKGSRFMTLGPSVLQGGEWVDAWYETFVRFGKHGGKLAKSNAFKKPLLMADRGAVLKFANEAEVQYIGKGIKGISTAHPETVHQGYAITIAIWEERQ